MKTGQTIIAKLPAWLSVQKGIKGEFQAVVSHMTAKAALLDTKEVGAIWAPISQLQIVRTLDVQTMEKAAIDYSDLLREPWPHQLECFNFGADKAGMLDASDMGVGKTFNIIALWNARQPMRTLIVAPNTAVRVWPNEFNKLTNKPFDMLILASDGPSKPKTKKLPSGSTITTVGGLVANRAQVCEDFMAVMKSMNKPCIVVVNYEAAWRYPLGPELDDKNNVIASKQGVFGKADLDLVVLDEAHRIKRVRGKTSQFFIWLSRRAKMKRALTGTPSANGPLDVYQLIKFVDPTVFPPTFGEFRTRYAICDRFNNPVSYQNMDEYAEKLAGVTFRVLAKDVLNLPGANHTFRSFALSDYARKIYDQAEGKAVTLNVGDPRVTPDNVLVELIRCQQITAGYVIDDDKEYHRIDEGKGKDAALLDVLDDLDEQEPVIVFAKFAEELRIIEDVVAKTGRPYREISGPRKDGLSAEGKLVHLPEDEKGPVIGVQIDSGGSGVDLVKSTTAVYWSTGYNLVSYDQSLKRNHRPGQEFAVTYIHLVADETVDYDVIDALDRKTRIINYTLGKMTERQREKANGRIRQVA